MSSKFQTCILLVTSVAAYSIPGCTGNKDQAAQMSNDTAAEPKPAAAVLTNPSISGADQGTEIEHDAPPKLPSLDEVQARRSEPDDDENAKVPATEVIAEVHTIPIPAEWKRLSEQQEIWVDLKSKEVIAGGHICLDGGMLEVFICPRQTKEHESVISVNALSSQVHAALLAVGAEPGQPVKWQDEYEAASGPVIQITVMWRDDETGQVIKRRGQELVRNIDTGKVMQHDWVFGGSQTYTDPETGETYYYGDSGELVCLSNFSTATMDVPVKSSDANDGLLFEANTPNIPPVGTKIYVVFKPAGSPSEK